MSTPRRTFTPGTAVWLADVRALAFTKWMHPATPLVVDEEGTPGVIWVRIADGSVFRTGVSRLPVARNCLVFLPPRQQREEEREITAQPTGGSRGRR